MTTPPAPPPLPSDGPPPPPPGGPDTSGGGDPKVGEVGASGTSPAEPTRPPVRSRRLLVVIGTLLLVGVGAVAVGVATLDTDPPSSPTTSGVSDTTTTTGA